MHKVGITGGIGSGKSTICRVFRQLGVPIYDADGRGKDLLREDPLVKEKVVAAFGSEAYESDGSLNKDFLAEQVFSNPKSLNKLNAIVHPAVRKDFEAWLGQQNAPYVLKEAAILIESGAYKEMDEIIVVEAKSELRLQRVVERDKTAEAKVLERMNNQLTDEERKEYADHCIDNNDDHLVIPQIIAIHEDIILRTSS